MFDVQTCATQSNKFLPALCTCRSVPELIRAVVQGVLKHLGRPALQAADMPVDKPVDMHQRVADVKQHLTELASTSSAVLGLHGMSGIGKTTLAKAVYNDMRSEFVSSCFLEVGSRADEAALVQLQRIMLRALCGVDVRVHSVEAGHSLLSARLRTTCVLLVLDDVWNYNQLSELLVTVGEGSRVLVTSKNKGLLQRHQIAAQLPVHLLSHNAAMELFLRLAQPTPECSDLAASIVAASGGLPLTLTRTGELLQGQQKRSHWEAALHRLRQPDIIRDAQLAQQTRCVGRLTLNKRSS